MFVALRAPLRPQLRLLSSWLSNFEIRIAIIMSPPERISIPIKTSKKSGR
jgi:hypothetical protein